MENKTPSWTLTTLRVVAKAEALTGPMTPPAKREQTINPPRSEMGPGTVATWGKPGTNEVDALGFKWQWNDRSSKHIPFGWSMKLNYDTEGSKNCTRMINSNSNKIS